jgi:hypothetical protein
LSAQFVIIPSLDKIALIVMAFWVDAARIKAPRTSVATLRTRVSFE